MIGNKPDFNEVLQKMRDKYLSELPDKLDRLEDIAIAITAQDAIEENLQELYRIVHGIKGSAGTYGIPVVSTICHRFEDRINADQEDVLEGERPFVDDALRFIDLMRETVTRVEEAATNFSAIEEKLDALSISSNAPDGEKIRPMTLLVADSARTTTVLLRAAMADRAVNVITAVTDFAALERLMEERFDVVVCGLGIGKIGGLGLIASLKLSESRSRDAVTILLASDTDNIIQTNPAPDVVLKRGPSLGEDVAGVIDSYASRLTSQ